MRRDWLRSFARDGTGPFHVSRFESTPRVLFLAQGLNSWHDQAIVNHIRGALKTFGLLPGAMRDCLSIEGLKL